MMDYDKCILVGLTYDTAMKISNWEYDKPYAVYNFKGKSNGYLLDEDTWGKEQFCLKNEGDIIGQVACQFDNDNLWVGWSLSPLYCGQGSGHIFVQKCIEQIRNVMEYNGTIYLNVVAWNKRAIKAYQKAGFVYFKTVKDEIAYTNIIEEFWVMINKL
jgi:RimJ/RimL family protein N-acetyltransferase